MKSNKLFHQLCSKIIYINLQRYMEINSNTNKSLIREKEKKNVHIR